MKYVRIPRDRIPVLIGEHGHTKKDIKQWTGVDIEIDSKTGDVSIQNEGVDDPVAPLKVQDFVKAVGRGFSPENAQLLLNDGYYFLLLEIKDFSGKNKKRSRQIKGRIIGTDGKTRSIIEEMSGAHVTVYGDTVGIIGEIEDAEMAREALIMLMSGSEHSTVYNYLQKKKRKKSMKSMLSYYGEG